MDQFPQMLYRAGGPEQLHGGNFATLTVDSAEALEAALADGWHESTPAALKAMEPAEPVEPAAPSRAEMEQKATELGIKFDGRWGDKKLADAIAAKLADAGT